MRFTASFVSVAVLEDPYIVKEETSTFSKGDMSGSVYGGLAMVNRNGFSCS